MTEAVINKEATAFTTQPTRQDAALAPIVTPAPESASHKVRLVYMIRLALGMSVLLSWGVLPLHSMWTTWMAPQMAPQAGPVQATAQQTPTKSDIFMPVLYKARTYCPANARVLVLNNGSAADSLSDYYVYPRRTDMIELDDPFSAADLDTHVGGCLIYYGPQAEQRLAPFKARLREVLCSSEGCLYGIER